MSGTGTQAYARVSDLWISPPRKFCTHVEMTAREPSRAELRLETNRVHSLVSFPQSPSAIFVGKYTYIYIIADKKLDRFAGEFGAFHHIREILFVMKNNGREKTNRKERKIGGEREREMRQYIRHTAATREFTCDK